MYATDREIDTVVPYVPTSQRDSGRALAAAFERAVAHRSDGAMQELQLATRAFVAQLKMQGLAPERVVVVVKSLVRAGDRYQWEPSLELPPEHEAGHAHATVYAELFHWCLETYFSEDSC